MKENAQRASQLSVEEVLEEGHAPALFTVPDGHHIEDISSIIRAFIEHKKPTQRKGTARLTDLDSFIAWVERFKGENTVIFAEEEGLAKASLCAIIDYHGQGPPITDGSNDPTASHMLHRGVYRFPLSDEWRYWNEISGRWIGKDQMGEFIEARALDVAEPTPNLLNREPTKGSMATWEQKMYDLARAIEGRFGSFSTFLQLSKRFTVYESSNIEVTSNRDTGEQSIAFTNEHKDQEGKPISLPNLVLIQIPVLKNGPKYRMAVRFRYKKQGQQLAFQFTLVQPDAVFRDAFNEAVDKVEEETGTPIFYGFPEGA